MNTREAAYIALLASMRNEAFISHSLQKWMHSDSPDKLDFAFAYEIASGSARMASALDYLASKLPANKKISLKVKERALVRTAIYQYCYMEKVPLYAIVNETVELAKKYCHRTFSSYLNALLRRLEDHLPAFPAGNGPDQLSIRYSYPLYFVEALIADYGKELAEKILIAGNTPPKVMARIRPGFTMAVSRFKLLGPENDPSVPMTIIDKGDSFSGLSEMEEIYIQNITPASLVASLAQRTKPPAIILDLCASPGGKLLAAHDRFPTAKLFANDVSPEKILRLSQNLVKYKVEADIVCGPGENYPSGRRFDLIILDVPCSNSGVLNKRPEARWRLTAEALENLGLIQLRLLEHAANLLAPDGVIWYLTCSILKGENEELVEQVMKRLGLTVDYSRTMLPNKNGWDGGFCALLRNKRIDFHDL